MMTTRIPLGLVLGLATAACGAELDVGDKPQNIEPSTTDGSGEDSGAPTSTDDGPGMTSAMEGTTTGEPPTSVSPPCDYGATGPDQDPAVQWGVVCGGSASEYIAATAVDDAGAVYVLTQVENYEGQTILFGDDEVTPSPSLPTLLLSKLSPDGTFEWNRAFQGEVDWWAPSSLVACDDRIYFTANRAFTGTESVDFGSGPVDGNLAIVAFDSDGNNVWSQATGQNDEQSGGFPTGKVTCRPGGGIMVYGVTATDMEIGGIEFDGDVTTTSSTFVVAADADGNGVWGTMESSTSLAAALDDDGGVVTLGWVAAESPDVSAVALTRYGADGTQLWRQIYGSTGATQPISVLIDDDGAITITGAFAGETDLGQGPLVSADPIVVDDPADPFDDATQYMDAYVARYDADGNSQWVETFSDVGLNYATAVRHAAGGGVDVLLTSPGGTVSLSTVEDGGATALAELPGDYVQVISANPLGGFGIAYTSLDGLSAFAPPLTGRMPTDFIVTRVAP